MTRTIAGRTMLLRLAALAVIAVLSCGAPDPAAAQQGGWWPWASEAPPAPRPPPIPREPVGRGGPGQPQGGPGQPQPGGPPPAMQRPGQGPQEARRPGGNICFELEQRLVQESQRGGQSQQLLPKIETDLREADRAARTAEARLERSDCYEQWFFSRTLRKDPRCRDMATQTETAKRRVAELDAQRQQILGTGGRSHQEEIIRELAHNNCGQTYQQQAERQRGKSPFSSLWQDEDTGPTRGNEFGALPFATYRTICVRLCDGYYFPVSFSTLENHFTRDSDACQSKCAAPAELYYYQNPGEAVEQARSVKGRQPYTTLRTAFLYRKQYVQGCSCKVSEYTPTPADRGDRRTEAPAPSAPPRQAQR